MQYFPRNSPNSLKISPKFRANNHIQSLTNADPFIKTKTFLLHFRGNFIGFNLGNTAWAATVRLGSKGLRLITHCWLLVTILSPLVRLWMALYIILLYGMRYITTYKLGNKLSKFLLLVSMLQMIKDQTFLCHQTLC